MGMFFDSQEPRVEIKWTSRIMSIQPDIPMMNIALNRLRLNNEPVVLHPMWMLNG